MYDPFSIKKKKNFKINIVKSYFTTTTTTILHQWSIVLKIDVTSLHRSIYSNTLLKCYIHPNINFHQRIQLGKNHFVPLRVGHYDSVTVFFNR